MSFNTDADKFWRVLTWVGIAAVIILPIAWVYYARTPDLPFQVWLAGASRDDVWWWLCGCVYCGVAFGRIVTRQ